MGPTLVALPWSLGLLPIPSRAQGDSGYVSKDVGEGELFSRQCPSSGTCRHRRRGQGRTEPGKQMSLCSGLAQISMSEDLHVCG